MLTHFLCGSSGFQEAEEEGEVKVLCTSAAAPWGSRKKASNKNKNRFSTRGLDKFASVLAQLEEKKHKICSQMPAGSQEILLVRFRCSGSEDWLPIVVKLRGSRKGNCQQNKIAAAGVGDHDKVDGESVRRLLGQASVIGDANRKKAKTMMGLSMAVLVSLLLLLAFGRSFAIMCACILWYLAPKMREGNEGRWRKGKCRSLVR